jgi:hypothetical protein
MTDPTPVTTHKLSSRGQLWLLIALFFVPLAFAFIMYYGFDWRPAGTTNKGDLITPARPLPSDQLIDPQDQPIAEQIFKERRSR